MRNVYSTIGLLLTILTLSQSCIICPRPEDAKLNFTQLGHKYGHTVKEFDVITDDGYILTLFHIPGKKKGPILLMHGIICSADMFIMRGNLSLAITLANRGHDVWIGNTRGNKYARRHLTLNPDVGPDFWDFSFHEAGYYDLAATIDFILDATGESSIRTIGHSQGTTIHFVLFSTRPEYNKKVKGFIALAPIAFLNNLEFPVSTMTKVWPLVDEILYLLGKEELLQDKTAATKLIEFICSQGIISYGICYLILVSPFSGFDSKRLEPEFWKVVTGHFPAATSRKGILHYVNVARYKRFAHFDDSSKSSGKKKHKNKKGEIPARNYDLRKITTKIALVVGKNDALSTVKDVDILKSRLPKKPSYHLMKPSAWSHLDFIGANDMDVYLYPYVFSKLRHYK